MLSSDSHADAIVLLARSPTLIRAVEAGACGRRVVNCSSAIHLASAATSSLLGIVYEAAFDGCGPHSDIATMLSDARCAILVVLTDAPNAVLDTFELAKHSNGRVDYVVVGRNWVERAVTRLVSGRSTLSAVATILDRLLPFTPLPLRASVMRCVLLAQDGAEVEDLVHACGSSGSAVRAAFRKAGVSAPSEWLWSLRAAHAAWDVLELGQRQATVAKRRHFAGQSSLSHCVKKYTGHNLTDWRASGAGFTTVLDACAARCLSRLRI